MTLLLPRPKSLTGEVLCGLYVALQLDEEEREDSLAPYPHDWGYGNTVCDKPANHEGDCRFTNKPLLNMNPPMRAHGNPSPGASWGESWGWDEDWIKKAYASGNVSGRARAQQAEEWRNNKEDLFRYAYGGARQAEDRTQRGYDVHIDYSAGKDFAVYSVEHPDTHKVYEINVDDFNTIYKACAVGPTAMNPVKYAKIAREVLKKYAR